MNSVQKRAPRARWGDREGRRQDILSAAEELLQETGYAALSMRALADRAGVSAGTLYLYFDTKEEIFLHLYGARIERLREEGLRRAGRARTLAELLRSIAGAYRVFYDELGRHLNPWALAADPMAVQTIPRELILGLRAQVAEIFLEMAERMNALAAREGLVVPRPEIAVPFLWTVFVGLSDAFSGPKANAQPYTWDELVSFAVDTLVRGLTEPLPR